MEITYDIVDMVLYKIKTDCKKNKGCKGCRFNKNDGCPLRFIPEDWRIEKPKQEGVDNE